MSTFKTHDESLTDLLSQITTGKIQLPDFQRGWIWDDDHIRDLLVSIANSFPIGAVMFLECGGNTNFQVRPIEGVKFSKSMPTPDLLILDGQQRLTSLTCALSLKKPVKTRNDKKVEIDCHYYIDINTALEKNKMEEAIISVGPDRILKTNFGRDILLDLSTVQKECEEFYFPCNQILDSDDWELNLNKYAKNNYDKFLEFRRDVLRNFRYYKIPTITLGDETQREAVCLVFEKVNTGGVPLSVFELVTAGFAAESFNLRIDWFGDEEKDIEGRQSELHKESVLKEIGTTEFLQAISLLATFEKRNRDIEKGKTGKAISAISAKRNSILSLTVGNYKEWAPQLVDGFLRAAKFLRKQCIYDVRDLPYQTQIVPLAAVLTLIEDRWLEPKIYKKLCRWYWCGVFGEFYGGAGETKIANDLNDLIDWIDDNEGTPRTIRDTAFQSDRLLTLKTRTSAAYKGLYSLILQEGAEDFFWMASVLELDVEDMQLDIHHIFPKKWCKKNDIDPDIFNSIINKTPISRKANKIIGGESPSSYLTKIQSHSQVGLSDEEMNNILVTHGIDPDSIRSNNFFNFFELRKEHLLDLIEKKMGKKIERD